MTSFSCSSCAREAGKKHGDPLARSLLPSLLYRCSRPLQPTMQLPTSTLAALFASLVFSSFAAAAPTAELNNNGGPVVDLGKYGKFLGTVQNNGTVHSWKGESSAPSFLSPLD